MDRCIIMYSHGGGRPYRIVPGAAGRCTEAAPPPRLWPPQLRSYYLSLRPKRLKATFVTQTLSII
eukprot:scaffold75114_cov20-Prasinocladus_malaysianus.AAC.1